jgi:hypothetical protein
MRRMRNPYREILRTYVGWRLVAVLLLLLLVLPTLLPELLHRDDSGRISMDIVVAGALLAMPMFSAVPLTDHLKAMLGSPRSRLTPGLHRRHLVIAGPIALAVMVVLPLTASLTAVGVKGPHLPLVAAASAAFVVAAFLATWHPNAGSLAAMLFWIAPMLLRSSTDHVWLPSTANSILLLTVALTCFVLLAFRYARFNEEMYGYTKRSDWERSAIDRGRGMGEAAASRRKWEISVPVPRNVRSLWAERPNARQNRWRQVLHWNVAWRTMWEGVFGGAAMSGLVLLLEVSFHADRPGHNVGAQAFSSADSLLLAIFLPVIANFPAGYIFGSTRRSFALNEVLRTYSRAVHFQTVGLGLAASSLLGALSAVGLLIAGRWIIAGDCTPSGDMLRALAVATCSMPLFFALSAGHWSPAQSLRGLVGIPVLYLAACALALLPSDPFWAGLSSIGLLAVGWTVLRAAYQSWLDADLD